jgi:hypothetical protein
MRSTVILAIAYFTIKKGSVDDEETLVRPEEKLLGLILVCVTAPRS